MNAKKNIAIVREVLDKGFGDGDLDVVDQYVAADFIEHQDGAQGRGPQALKDIITGLHASFTEMHLHIQDIVAIGDDVWRAQLAPTPSTPCPSWRPRDPQDDRDLRHGPDAPA